MAEVPKPEGVTLLGQAVLLKWAAATANERIKCYIVSQILSYPACRQCSCSARATALSLPSREPCGSVSNMTVAPGQQNTYTSFQ